MSFSSDIKEELCHTVSEKKDCCLAETLAYLRFLGNVENADGQTKIRLATENVTLARKMLLMLKKVFLFQTDLSIRNLGKEGRSHRYEIWITDPRDISRMLEETGIRQDQLWMDHVRVSADCRKAYLRGAFLCGGSMSDPGKSYHFEISCRSLGEASFLTSMIAFFHLDARITKRKKRAVVYMKDSAQISDMLSVMGAYQALMQMENIRIIKDMRNTANRKFNCDNANINKMVRASGRQVQDIIYIRDHMGLDQLSPNLREMAELRLAYPEMSLQELGTHLTPPIGKSGVNHRLRNLSKIAEDLRGQRE